MTTLESETAALERFYGDVAAAGLQPLWTQTRDLMTPTPRGGTRGHRWPWHTLSALAHRSGDLIPIERGGERRVLALANPGLGGLPFATSTLWAAVQFLGPHETAPAHRHSPGAVRFVLQGEGVWTAVDGDPCPMSPGDLVLTPGGTWHEHHNPGDDTMIWFDGLDLPMVAALDAVFFETREDEAPNTAAPDRSPGEALHGHPGLRPDGVPAPAGHSPLSVYRRAHTDAALTDLLALRAAEPSVGVTFTDPATGRDVLPTLRCRMERLRPGARTATTRTAGSSVRVAFSGHGTTTVDGVRFAWGPGDMITVPSWAAVDHRADDAGPADVFVLSDAPVLEALRLDRHVVVDPQA
ncbi:gentisate 1,2-dioxygenase [Actinomycetospora sp. NBRC 106375]|uniref:cupin domain-containing protein n=1 Tax=Actinomycetospora sp. NBRC 106375 TaxID=3032207 RepID=UPI0024A1A522|nr:cupin domain-containing protein [Actinomycetospora sp. NBRC 106375]GLZ45414.1 gentisate 1,2-dioxygenase [Actinomycetospora sp. NBRC 106375]